MGRTRYPWPLFCAVYSAFSIFRSPMCPPQSPFNQRTTFRVACYLCLISASLGKFIYRCLFARSACGQLILANVWISCIWFISHRAKWAWIDVLECALKRRTFFVRANTCLISWSFLFQILIDCVAFFFFLPHITEHRWMDNENGPSNSYERSSFKFSSHFTSE